MYCYIANKVKSLIFNCIIAMIVCFFDSVIIINNSFATNPYTTLDSISSITCETQGAIGGLVRSEFTHTCIPSSYAEFAIANIISPGLYASTFLKLKINDEVLHKNSCKRDQRINFHDQKLDFSLCSNLKLIPLRTVAVGKTIGAIAQSIVNKKDDKHNFKEIEKAWDVPKDKYHESYFDKKPEDHGVLYDVPFPIPWKIIRWEDKLCVATQSVIDQWRPVGCKYIKEPYPVSIYSDFIDIDDIPNDIDNTTKEYTKFTSLTTCGTMGGCYKRAYNNSKAAIVMSGPLITCVEEMIAKLMVSQSVCSFDDVTQILDDGAKFTRASSSLFQFQQNMHSVVVSLLTIYVIFFGIKIVLAQESLKKNDAINFIIKFIFVAYFSVGINSNPNSAISGTEDLVAEDRLDGIIQWVLPFLLGGMQQLSSWVMNATPSGLCQFNDLDYPKSLEHIRLWDSLDCKIAHYIGLDAIQNMIVENATRKHDFDSLDFFSFSIPPYALLLYPAVKTMNFPLISLAIMYPLLLISVAAFAINITIACMIAIVILAMLAPIFVPLYLFEYTKHYFESWAKLLLSFMLQPVVAVTFMTIMLSIYDLAFYGTCKYRYTDFSNNGPKVNVEFRSHFGNINAGLENRKIRYFFVDQDWNANYTREEEEGCKKSLGFLINNVFQIADFIATTPGQFFDIVGTIFEKVLELMLALFTAIYVLFLMYHLSSQLHKFAAEITGGVSLEGMSVGAQTVYKNGMKALNLAKKAHGSQNSTSSASGSKDLMKNADPRKSRDSTIKKSD